MTPLQIIFNWLVIIAAKAFYNWYQIERQHKYPKHGRQIFIIAVIALVYIGLSGVRNPDQWELALTILLYQATAYWFLFDAALNLMRGKNILYIGIPDKEDAATDQFFYKYPNLYTWSKIVCIPFIIYAVIWIERLRYA